MGRKESKGVCHLRVGCWSEILLQIKNLKSLVTVCDNNTVRQVLHPINKLAALEQASCKIIWTPDLPVYFGRRLHVTESPKPSLHLHTDHKLDSGPGMRLTG